MNPDLLFDVSPRILAWKSPQYIVNYCSTDRRRRAQCNDNFWKQLLTIRYGSTQSTAETFKQQYIRRYQEEVDDMVNSVVKNVERFYRLIQRGVDPELRDSQGQLALHVAAKNSVYPVVKFLLEEAQVNPDQFDEYGYTALMNALYRDCNTNIALTLLDYATDITTKYPNGDTLLHRAARNGCNRVIQKLLQLGASTSVVNKEGLTPLLEAIKDIRRYRYGSNQWQDRLNNIGLLSLDTELARSLNEANKEETLELIDQLEEEELAYISELIN